MSLFQRLRKRAPTLDRDPLEDFVTESLAWLMEANPSLARAFVRSLTETSLPTEASVRWKTQVHLSGTGFVDLVAFVAGGPILVFEHKVWAALSEGQIEKYRAALSASHGDRVRTVLITAHRRQWTQAADKQLLWADVYKTVADWAAANEGLLVSDFLGLLRAEGLAPAAPVSHDGLVSWFPSQTLLPALRALFQEVGAELRNLDLRDVLGSVDPPTFYEKHGRLGIEFASVPVWRPGLFAGVLVDPGNYQCRASNPELGPDLCVIVNYHLDPGTPSWDAFVGSPDFAQMEDRLRGDAAGFDLFLVRDRPTSEQNRWHPLHLRRPLLTVLGGATHARDQAERVASVTRAAIDVLLSGGELARLRRDLGARTERSSSDMVERTEDA